MPTLITRLTQYWKSQAEQLGKKTRHPHWKERSKAVTTALDMILYKENAKDFTKKLLTIINEYSKVAGYKINIQKSVVFLYANNELAEIEIKKTIPFTITTDFCMLILYPATLLYSFIIVNSFLVKS